MHFSQTRDIPTDRRTDGPTDRPTDRPTDTPSYRDARTHLKTEKIRRSENRTDDMRKINSGIFFSFFEIYFQEYLWPSCLINSSYHILADLAVWPLGHREEREFHAKERRTSFLRARQRPARQGRAKK